MTQLLRTTRRILSRRNVLSTTDRSESFILDFSPFYPNKQFFTKIRHFASPRFLKKQRAAYSLHDESSLI